MSITYNATDNEITIEDQNNVTMQDIYDADQSGGWGVFDKMENLYFSSANIKLVNAGVKDEDVGLQIGTSSSTKSLNIDSNSSWEFKNSFMLLYNPTIYIYNLILKNSLCNLIGTLHTYYTQLTNSIIVNTGDIYFKKTLNSSNSVTIGFNIIFHEITLSNITNSKFQSSIIMGESGSITIRDSTIVINQYIRAYNATFYIINCDLNKEVFSEFTSNGIVYIGYEFYPKIIDNESNGKQGAIVKLTNSKDEEVVNETTDENGEISSQDIYVKKIYGSDETEIDYNPFKLNITYCTNELEITNITIDRNWDKNLIPIKDYSTNDIMKMLKAIYVK